MAQNHISLSLSVRAVITQVFLSKGYNYHTWQLLCLRGDIKINSPVKATEGC